MKNKYIEKYKELDETAFATGCPFEYVFDYKGKEYHIDFDWKERKGYLFSYDWKKEKPKLYKTIYDALDKIKFDGKSLRELLLTTDFNFTSIL